MATKLHLIASHREARPLTGRPGLYKGGRVSHREAGPLTGRQGLSQGGRASYREAGPLTGRQGLFKGSCASYREAWPVTGRQGLSQGGWASKLANSQLHNLPKRPIKTYIFKNINILIMCKSQHFFILRQNRGKLHLVALTKSFRPRKAVPTFQRILIPWSQECIMTVS